MLDSMLLCRYERMVRPQARCGRLGMTTTGTGVVAWRGSKIAGRPEQFVDIAQIGSSACSAMPISVSRIAAAQGLSEARRVLSESAGAAVVKISAPPSA